MSEQTPSDPGTGSTNPTAGTGRELLTISVEPTAAGVQATVAGELDESTAPRLINRIQGEVGPGQDVIIDLGGLTFCGSAGLSALIIIQRAVAAGGGSTAVTRPTPFLVQLLEMAGLDGLISSSPAS